MGQPSQGQPWLGQPWRGQPWQGQPCQGKCGAQLWRGQPCHPGEGNPAERCWKVGKEFWAQLAGQPWRRTTLTGATLPWATLWWGQPWWGNPGGGGQPWRGGGGNPAGGGGPYQGGFRLNSPRWPGWDVLLLLLEPTLSWIQTTVFKTPSRP